jgi:hypothetical protein
VKKEGEKKARKERRRIESKPENIDEKKIRQT